MTKSEIACNNFGNPNKMTSLIQVPYSGPTSATIAVIGEAPGQIEELRRQPFVGPSGQIQDQCMSYAKIRRSQIRMMNIMQYRPPGNDFSYFWQDKKQVVPSLELLSGIATLRDSLIVMPNLKVIVAYGRQPMFILTAQDGITNCRGSVYKCRMEGLEHVYVIPTFHPAFILRNYRVISLVIHDLKLAQQVSQNGYHPLQRTLNPYPTDQEIRNYLNKLEFDITIPTAVDIECYQGMISRISLSYDPALAISIPFINLDTNEILPNREWIWDRLRSIFLTLPTVGQNFTFDMIWMLKKQNVVFGNFVHDTMTAQHKLINDYPDFLKPNSLGFLTSIYTTNPYYKDELKIVHKGRKNLELIDKRYGNYSCMDASITKEVEIEQTTLLNQDEYHKAKFQFEMDLINGPIMWMMSKGIRFDVEKQKGLSYLYNKRLKLLEYLIAYENNKWINVRSPQQVSKLLYGTMKLTGTGCKKTGEDQLKILVAKYPGKLVLRYILDYRELEQIRKNILSAKCADDNRMKCSYGTTTIGGRFASSTNPFGFGTNLQNVPRLKEVRHLFLPDPDKYICECDLKGAELWPVAFLSEEPKMMEKLLNGDDLHLYNASIIFNKPEDQVITQGSTNERTTGKTCFHGYDYCMTETGLIKAMRKDHGIDLDKTTARLYLSRLHKAFPRIKNNWHKQVEDDLRNNNKTMITGMNRKIQFLDRMSDKLLRNAISLNPRSTIADLLNEVMKDWFNKYNNNTKLNCQLLMQNHDAFSIQFPKNKMEDNLDKLREVFNHPIVINGYEITIPVEIVVSDKWKGETIYEEVCRYT